ncbi:hypothetical protein AYO20_09111 [Fonsecaea nubica]|uniref:Uncharacterized protein n=1 Tax=Fonsecaea nubica TaxID=856822 RepID=A0A178CJP9_9EURO|nr:hypothetical protein AYO20_09111 [Fonsecaea nubica]OAL29727.1 hypothetical protein AYO20_09111 [Fonsecaea nubica]
MRPRQPPPSTLHVFDAAYGPVPLEPTQFVSLCAYLCRLLRWGWHIQTADTDAFIRLIRRWFLQQPRGGHGERILTELTLRELWRDNRYLFLRTELSLCSILRRNTLWTDAATADQDVPTEEATSTTDDRVRMAVKAHFEQECVRCPWQHRPRADRGERVVGVEVDLLKEPCVGPCMPARQILVAMRCRPGPYLLASTALPSLEASDVAAWEDAGACPGLPRVFREPKTALAGSHTGLGDLSLGAHTSAPETA